MAAVAPNALCLPVDYALLWYRIRGVLGQGGFGITYLAYDTNLDQRVAIKEYLPQLFATRGTNYSITPTSSTQADDYRWGLQRFLEEGRLLARFDHPSIVRVYSVFEANSTAYLVMRFEDGEPLEALLKREPLLPEAQLREILTDVMTGLDVIHSAGFIHRDIKPSNIYLRQDGHAVLLDFGAARQALSTQTQNVTSLVSPGYAPFEQYRSDGLAQGPWTDIYGLGATAYRAITGRTPPAAVDRSQRILDGSGDHQPSLATSGIDGYSFGFLAAIDRALAFRAGDRPVSIAAWRALSEYEETITAQPPIANIIRESDNEAGIKTERQLAFTDERIAPEPILPFPSTSRVRQSGLLVAGIVIGCGIGIPYALRNSSHAPAVQTAVHASANEIEDISRASAVKSSVAELLREADIDLAAMRLTTPENGNALIKFRAALAHDPENARAKRGIQKIIGRYLDLATTAANNQDFGAARDYLKRAQEVNPQDPRTRAALLALARSEGRAIRTTKNDG